MLLINAISQNMLPLEGSTVSISPLSIMEASSSFTCPFGTGKKILDSAIGHEDMAKVVSSILGFEVPAIRRTVKMRVGECAILAQYTGPRLPEGATKLPEGAEIRFYDIFVFGKMGDGQYTSSSEEGN